MQNKDEVKQERRMRLWNPTQGISNTKLGVGDEYSICEQFFRKTNCIKDGKPYRPDISKDCVLSGYYNFEQFDFYEFINREKCVETLRCTRLRKQNFELMEYARKETLLVEVLVVRYHQEKDEKTRIVLKELAKVKMGNIKLIEHARGRVIEIFSLVQEAGDYLDKAVKIIKKEKAEMR